MGAEGEGAPATRPGRCADGAVARAALGGLVILLAASAGLGLTYNSTPSLPRGVYQIRPLHGAPHRGQVVGFCLSGEAARLALARGYVHPQGLEPVVYGTRCPSGAGVIGKPVAGLPGDTIVVGRAGVAVNGRPLRASRVSDRDRAGRTLPAAWGRRVLGAGEYWLQSEFAPNSYDSRIFGAVRREDILDRRIFLATFPGALAALLVVL